MRDSKDRRVTSPKRVTSPSRGVKRPQAGTTRDNPTLSRVNPVKARQSQHARGLLTRESTTIPLSVDTMVAVLQLECLKYANKLHAL